MLGIALSVLLSLIAAAGAHGEGAASWRFEPAEPPPPPPGTPPGPYEVPVGEVGQISFWAPNRGLLITGGTESLLLSGGGGKTVGGPVPSGLYAYDGESWHQLATVCGGSSGRIAWAGPDEFWAVADQRPGQSVSGGTSTGELEAISLCHFLDGQVVGSYALPLQQPDSYRRMDAAVCRRPNDCWFGGEVGTGLNEGSFHLHWDGSAVTAVYEPEDHAVASMANFDGTLYESVQIASTDRYGPEEEAEHPSVIHEIAPAATSLGVSGIFRNLELFSNGESLPIYPKEVEPFALGGFALATDASPLGSGGTQLWGMASPLGEVTGSLEAPLTVLRYAEGAWSQIVPDGKGRSPFPSGTKSVAIAPEPGSEHAWVALRNGFRSPGAEMALLNSSGALEGPILTLPETQDGVGFRGNAGPVVCPAPHDCWMATTPGERRGPDSRSEIESLPGWLFHFTDGSDRIHYPRDTDPNFAGVITYRPPDSGVPVIYPDLPPADNSLANQARPPAPTPPIEVPATPVKAQRRQSLVIRVKSRFLHHRELIVSFTLTARAHVQLIARRRHVVVARTHKESLPPGRHELSLSFDPTRWPTGLQFRATPVGHSAPAGEQPGLGGAGNTITTE